MLQLPAIIILSLSVFVGRVCPVLQKEGHNSTTTEVTANAENTTNISIGSGANGTNATSVKQPNNETATSGALSEHSPPESDAKPLVVANEHDRKKQNCNSTKESVDMLNCYVHPTDDDDDDDNDDKIVVKAPPSNTTDPAVPRVPANESSVNNTKSPPGKVNADSTTQKSMTDITETVVTPLQNNTIYETVAENANHYTNGSIKGEETESDTKHTEPVVSTVVPLLAEKVRNKESDGINEAEISNDENNDKNMPLGITVLVITISFAVTIVIAYVGMIAWRRYIEYRYGHRELLVNELEFDTNDLRHFEL